MGEAPELTAMRGSHHAERRPPLQAGFQRLTGQRIVLGAGEPRCTVFGVLHRRAVTQQVSLSTAVDLARRGLSTVVRVDV